jgi:hypothetical protein
LFVYLLSEHPFGAVKIQRTGPKGRGLRIEEIEDEGNDREVEISQERR